jgi:hypothetical protein
MTPACSAPGDASRAAAETTLDPTRGNLRNVNLEEMEAADGIFTS